MTLPKSIFKGNSNTLFGYKPKFRVNNRKSNKGRHIQAISGHYDKDGNWINHKSIKFIKCL